MAGKRPHRETGVLHSLSGLRLLERHGYLGRSQGENDRRTVLVHLTDSGRQLARSLGDTNIAKFSHAFSAFHPSDRVERAVALDRVAAALEKAGDKE